MPIRLSFGQTSNSGGGDGEGERGRGGGGGGEREGGREGGGQRGRGGGGLKSCFNLKFNGVFAILARDEKVPFG